MKSASIGIIVLLLVTISLSTIGSTYACFTTVQVTGTHLVSTWQSYVWTQTTQSDFEQGVMVNVNTSTSPDSVILGNLTISPSVYGMTGNSGTGFSLYNISTNTWVTTAGTPADVADGGALAYTNNGNISALRGDGTTSFYQYNISSDTWVTMASTPDGVGAGGALAYTNNGNISALRGDGTTSFYQYNISSDTWVTMATL
ncbi:MAG: hypothetical protein LUQ04_06775, partial [Methanoregula sp.]|nr:hypothetical protein [Methanoregula sp.]